jgi:hypothetical protein
MMLLKRLSCSFALKGGAKAGVVNALRGKILEGKHTSVNKWCQKLQNAIKARAHVGYGKGVKPFLPVQEV